VKRASNKYRLRKATSADEPALRDLIARSIRALGVNDYSHEQIEGALERAFGVDTTLIRDQTYFVAVDGAGHIVGCGGWSKRRTLFGGDARSERDDSRLDPRVDAAKIRAFFVDPAHARCGIGRALLRRCELEAARAGFARFELMATLPGLRLYAQCGYIAGDLIQHPVGGSITITFVPMTKRRSIASEE
jgi:GNAT superfamily N-acetyltransferase